MPPQGKEDPPLSQRDQADIARDQHALHNLQQLIDSYCNNPLEEQRIRTLRALSSFHRLRRPFGGTSSIPSIYQNDAYLQSEAYNEIIMERLNISIPYDMGVLAEQPDSWKFLKPSVILQHPAVITRQRRIFVSSDLASANDFIVKFIIAAKQYDKFYLYAHEIVEREIKNKKSESESTSQRQI